MKIRVQGWTWTVGASFLVVRDGFQLKFNKKITNAMPFRVN